MIRSKFSIPIIFLAACFIMPAGVYIAKDSNLASINTPLKAAVFYFPSPTIMRCLNHSGIPVNYRKAFIYKKIKLKKGVELEENITVGVNISEDSAQKFLFSGNIKRGDEILPIKINGEIPFGLKSQGLNLGLFGLENFLGIPGKIHVKDNFGDQRIDYETFLRKTKGMIGNLNYDLELVGKDLAIDGEIKYFLDGKGNLGKFNVITRARDAGKDVYEVFEKYGPVEIISTVRVYE